MMNLQELVLSSPTTVTSCIEFCFTYSLLYLCLDMLLINESLFLPVLQGALAVESQIYSQLVSPAGSQKKSRQWGPQQQRPKNARQLGLNILSVTLFIYHHIGVVECNSDGNLPPYQG